MWGMNDIPQLCECGCGELAPRAPRTVGSRGIVKGQPLRFIHGHNRRKSGSEYLIDPESGCWIWLRAIAYARGGYGVSYTGQKPRDAHRVVYERHRGAVPPGMELHHKCHNPPCVNPDHLEPLTSREHRRLPRQKLTMEIARAIRGSDELGYVLAERYGVSSNAISCIRTGKTWRE